MTLVKSLFLSGAIASLTASIALADPKPANSVKADPQTYKDWSTGEWQVETDGKEDDINHQHHYQPAV